MIYSPCSLENAIRAEIEYLEKIQKEIAAFPSEKCRITAEKVGNTYQYFAYTAEDNTHHTLSKQKKLRQIHKLCQAEYNAKLADALTARLGLLTQVAPRLKKTNLDLIMRQIHPGKQLMIERCYLDENEFAERWALQEYQHKEAPAKGFHTDRGEVVRSKSEVLIANKLFANHIPYRYEEALSLPEYTLYPDFTVLNKRTRKEFVWEHLGMTSDVDYASNAFGRLMTYQKNGFVLGENLILSIESLKQPLDGRQIQRIIDVFLL